MGNLWGICLFVYFGHMKRVQGIPLVLMRLRQHNRTPCSPTLWQTSSSLIARAIVLFTLQLDFQQLRLVMNRFTCPNWQTGIVCSACKTTFQNNGSSQYKPNPILMIHYCARSMARRFAFMTLSSYIHLDSQSSVGRASSGAKKESIMAK